MATPVLSDGNIRLAFGAQPLAVSSIKNLLTGKEFCRHGYQSLLVRTPRAISDPVFLTEAERSVDPVHGATLTLRDPGGEYRALITMTPRPEGIAFRLRLDAPEPVWVVEWRLAGLDLSEVVLPALGGQSLGTGMPTGTVLTYKYPFWLNAQFVLGMTPGGGVWLRSDDVRPLFKFVRVKRAENTFTLSYGAEADGPLTSRTIEASWVLDCFKGSWKVPTDIYRQRLEQTFRPVRLDANVSVPSWMRDMDFVLEIWGIGKDSPEPFHTFDQIISRLKQWMRMHDPERTLVYLPGFAEHGIDSRAPSYAPSPQLGGAAEFHRLVDVARTLGYRVMVHTNALAMTFNHPRFKEFEQHQVVDVFGRPQGWGLDIDGDWLTEPYFAYINPGVPEWGEMLEQAVGELVRSYGVDGVFLDQTLLAFNVARGPNFVEGMRELILRLRRAFPEAVFAGEGLHEQILSALPLAQIHGLDSITEIHGMEGKVRWRNVHPISTYLFGPYTKFVGHLLTRHPSHGMFALQESSYAKLGVIPVLALYHHDQPIDTPEVRKMIRRAQCL